MDKKAYVITEFCRIMMISLPTYHKLKKLGLGPREMSVGGMIRISADAMREWIAARENPTGAEAEQAGIAAERRRAKARNAVARAGHCVSRQSGA